MFSQDGHLQHGLWGANQRTSTSTHPPTLTQTHPHPPTPLQLDLKEVIEAHGGVFTSLFTARETTVLLAKVAWGDSEKYRVSGYVGGWAGGWVSWVQENELLDARGR